MVMLTGTVATYGLSQLVEDSGVLLNGLIGHLSTWLGFFTANTAFLWIFIGGVAMLGLKVISSIGR